MAVSGEGRELGGAIAYIGEGVGYGGGLEAGGSYGEAAGVWVTVAAAQL